MPTIHQISLSGFCNHIELFKRLEPFCHHHAVVIEFKLSDDFQYPLNTLALLCAWYQQYGKSKEIRVDGDIDACRELEYYRVFHPIKKLDSVKHDLNQSVLPLMESSSETHRFIVDAILELVLSCFQISSIDFLEWPINELLDNIANHSASNGYVCARISQPDLLEIGIWDTGIGITETLKQADIILNDAQAIEWALIQGVRRSPKMGQGNGLAGTKEITELNQGLLEICSGTATYRQDILEQKWLPHPTILGTGIQIQLDLKNEVDLDQTFLGKRQSNYFNQLETLMDEYQVLNIAQETEHQGGRIPARLLRNRILLLLPTLDTPLYLDFSDVKFASSSFLDELFGFMILTLGYQAFKKHIQIKGMKETIQNRANVVIGQRLNDDANSM